jgi:carbamoyltransferase
VDPAYTLFGPHSYGERFTDRLVDLFGLPRNRESGLTDFHQNLAFAAQSGLEEAVMAILTPFLRETGMKKLCIAGGVGMNCKMNGHILQSGLVDDIFVLPAANDAGSALGAAMKVSLDAGDDPRFTMAHPYWGPGFSDGQIEAALKEFKLKYTRPADVAVEGAKLLAAEKILGWYQGRGEVGARALGARSILASPLKKEMLDKVNREVKHREPWRPFAPVMPEENAADFYGSAAPSPFMILAFDVLENRRAVIPAVTHVDGTCRPQTIRRDENPRYYDLLKHFAAHTGVPVLLNTSFNVRGEPIVNTPADAVRCFFATGMDYLVIGPFLVGKA